MLRWHQWIAWIRSVLCTTFQVYMSRMIKVVWFLTCEFQRIQAYRSAPLLSPMLDLSSSLLEAQRQLQRPDTTWSQVTPGGIRFTRRRLTDSSQHNNRNLIDMPNEVIDHVMSFLNKRDLLHMGATCKRFYLLSSNPRHWSFMNLSGKNIYDSALHRIISRRTKSLALMTSNVSRLLTLY